MEVTRVLTLPFFSQEGKVNHLKDPNLPPFVFVFVGLSFIDNGLNNTLKSLLMNKLLLFYAKYNNLNVTVFQRSQE